MDRVTHELGPEGARFHVVAFMLADEFAAFDPHQLDVVDVDPVAACRDTVAVAFKIAVADGDGAERQIVAQDPVLIVDEAAVLDRQVPRLGTNAGAVVITRYRSFARDPADRDVHRIDYKNALPGAGAAADGHAVAFDGEAVDPLRPNRAVGVAAGCDPDDVARTSHFRGIAWQR